MPVTAESLHHDASRFGADGDDNTAYEPFDTAKRQMVADLIAKEEQLLEEVATLKRTVPAAAAADQAASFDAAVKRDEEALQSRLAAEAKRITSDVSWAPLERQEGVETRFRDAVESLDRVKKDMPAVTAKLVRAKDAGEYVSKENRR